MTSASGRSSPINPHLYRLHVVHRRLDQEIAREVSRRWPDALRIARLKKLKLAIKDRLAMIGKRSRAVAS